MGLISTLAFTLNIVSWYGFTVLSTIYSKKYLNQTYDAHTLTLVTFLYAAVLKILRISNVNDLVSLLRSSEYVCLAIFNVGTILLTNIGMNETSVSLTYMVKASEPLFVLFLSYHILEESQELRVHLTLIPICFGVILIVFGELSLNLIGFTCAFAANLSSASRIVFYKAKLKDSSNVDQQQNAVSAFVTYLNVGFVSLCVYLPIYVIQIIISLAATSSPTQQYHTFCPADKIGQSFSIATDYLLYGSLFNFLYNLFSLRVLSNVAPISHSVINIMKRVFIVFWSMAVFSTNISPLQWSGMLCADLGVFLYSMFKISSKVIKVCVPVEKKELYKKFIVYSVIIILIGSCFITSGNKKFISTSKAYKDMRILCIEKIKDEIKSVSKRLIPKNRVTHLLDIPQHNNYGDTLIWLGEEQLLRDLGIDVKTRILSYSKNITSKEFMISKISPNETILLHGGGNFGDLYRLHVDLRNFIIKVFPTNKIVILPQTINYIDKKLANVDNAIYSNASDLSIMARSFDSYEFARTTFPTVRSVLVADAAFMLGDIKPLRKPTFDILVIRRTDKERQFDLDLWSALLRKKLNDKYTFLVRDWFDYKDVAFKSLKELGTRRLTLVNKIISQGRVIITDRLHASVLSVLMGKPHVIINEKYKKIWNTREAAFSDKPECSADYLKGYYANDIEEAIDIARSLLDEN